ncbi:hypothetical protein [Peptostreptococcus canis]|uniref:DUF3168 domain-containing protein n=1 Tax=Peptostreptococcus canis TaxID=1159213 RepID=A0ABR6TJ04_9FIRM|nr:hypothetical protein [Peptostreptococcus canis]MBC2575399.1 hypothetical protein [Peptostreptococcus canis]MBP1997417.1 hypothetical protein [Peptostreptococcus canis]
MNFNVGSSIPVATSFVKSNPAIPVYKGEENIENLYAVIYHIEIGYNKEGSQEVFQYIIVDYKDYNLGDEDRDEIITIAKNYCVEKGIDRDKNVEIKLLDDEIAEDFIEKVFNNMKVIRGLITND